MNGFQTLPRITPEMLSQEPDQTSFILSLLFDDYIGKNSREWRALQHRVPTITVTSTDPGAGSPLAENNFIFVVE